MPEQNPFSRRKFNVPEAQSPINDEPEKIRPSTAASRRRKADAVDADEPKVEAKKEVEQPTVPATTTASPEGETSERPDTDDTPTMDPQNPMKRIYSHDELLPVLDSLLQHGYALESFKIRGTEIMLRTRFTWEEQYIYQHLEDVGAKSALYYQREYTYITIAASIVKYGDYLFEPINKGTSEELDKSMADRYEFVCSLNSVITDILQMKLTEFDDKQRYIITHFDELLKAF